jgi:hypothetical protein
VQHGASVMQGVRFAAQPVTSYKRSKIAEVARQILFSYAWRSANN